MMLLLLLIKKTHKKSTHTPHKIDMRNQTLVVPPRFTNLDPPFKTILLLIINECIHLSCPVAIHVFN